MTKDEAYVGQRVLLPQTSPNGWPEERATIVAVDPDEALILLDPEYNIQKGMIYWNPDGIYATDYRYMVPLD